MLELALKFILKRVHMEIGAVRKYRPYKRLSEEQKGLIGKLFMEKMELRKIARVIGVSLFTVQYHIKKA
jgi:hypothetical protein